MTTRKPELPPLDPVDELLFGREIDVNSLHPQIRDIYASSFKELEEMDNVSSSFLPSSDDLTHRVDSAQALDNLLHHVAHVF